MKLRPRIVVPAVLGLTLLSALVSPDGPPGARRTAAWALEPFLAAASPLRLLRLGDGGGDDESAERWRRAYLDERARNVRLLEERRALPDVLGLKENPFARESLEAGEPRVIVAEVVGRDVSPLRHGILVNAGEEDGVVPGLPVTVGNALVGVVVRVWSGSLCQVRLLDDPQMRLRAAVVVEAGPDAEGAPLRPGNLEGLGGGRLRLRFVRGPGLVEGAAVVTTAEDWWIPPFLVVGSLSRVSDRDHDGIAEVLVEPAEPLEGLSVVSIWRRPDPPPGPWRVER